MRLNWGKRDVTHSELGQMKWRGGIIALICSLGAQCGPTWP